MKKSIFNVTALLLSLGILTGCGTAAAVTDVPELLDPVDIPVNTAEVMYRDIAITNYYKATVTPYVEEYSFPLQGEFTVAALYCRLGDDIKAGALLAETDHEAVDEQIAFLEKEIASEKKAVETQNKKYSLMIEKLNAQKTALLADSSAANSKGEAAVIDCDIEIYQTKLAQNSANLADKLEVYEEKLEALKENYSAYFLYAPMTGRVVYTASSSSQSRYSTVVAVADLSTIYLQTEYINESSIHTASRIYACYDGKTYDLSYVPYVYDTTEPCLLNTGGRSSRFYSGEVDFPLGSPVMIAIENGRIKNALTIPNTALNSDESGSFVYLVSDEGARTRQNIITGISDSIYTIVLDGLKEGDVVYVAN